MPKQVNVYPVIHHLDWETTYVEAAIAFKHEASGIFLISHGGDDFALVELAHTLKQVHKDKLIGINFLGHSAIQAFHFAAALELDAMWCDAPGITSKGISDNAAVLRDLQELSPHTVEVFASVAFKYQPAEPDPALAALYAYSAGFIPTTSGSGTGSPPDLEKIKAMSRASKGQLAIASGMTPENVSEYIPYITDVLVSTGISKDAYHFDEARLEAMVKVCRGY